MPDNRELLTLLKTYWGHDGFRAGQSEIIASLLSGQDTLAILPTGGGKSLCYQLPALYLGGVALVISPLIALMQDQVDRLAGLDIPAAMLSGALDRQAMSRLLYRAAEGDLRLLYISPERLQSRLFLEYLPALPLSFIAVDEAHCVSQWGHDFRAQYLEIRSIRNIRPRAPFLALTASATAAVTEDIARQLALRQPQLFRTGVRRSNLAYRVVYAEGRENALPGDIPSVTASGSTIVYARTRRETEQWARILQNAERPSVAYHAGMPAAKREVSRAEWMDNTAPVMVATSAFGMGIDKPDVRQVLHAGPPDSLEAYYQEAGRAGRDGAPAGAGLFYHGGDIRRLQALPGLQYPTEEVLRKVYGAVMEYLSIPAGTTPDRSYGFDAAELASRFDLKTTLLQPALRLLEREGLWTLSEGVFQPAMLWFTAEREEIDRLQTAHPALHVVAVAILRLYTGVLKYPAPVRLSAIARYLRSPAAAVEKALRQLSALEILRYEPSPTGPRIHVHHYRVPADHLQLNRERLLALRTAATTRSEAMVQYLQDRNTCRTRLMETYFSEMPGEDCGICDNCRQRQQGLVPLTGLRESVLDVIRRSPCTPLALKNALPAFDADAVAGEIRRLIDENRVKLKAGRLTLR